MASTELYREEIEKLQEVTQRDRRASKRLTLLVGIGISITGVQAALQTNGNFWVLGLTAFAVIAGLRAQRVLWAYYSLRSWIEAKILGELAVVEGLKKAHDTLGAATQGVALQQMFRAGSKEKVQ